MTSSPERHEPSTEAIEAVTTVPCGMCGGTGEDGSEDGKFACSWCDGMRTVLALGNWTQDAPRIAAQARAETVAEIVAWLRERHALQAGGLSSMSAWGRIATSIEAEFGTEGGEHG